MQPYGLEKRFCDMNEAPNWSRKFHDRQYRKLGRGRARQHERKQIDEMKRTRWDSSVGRANAL